MAPPARSLRLSLVAVVSAWVCLSLARHANAQLPPLAEGMTQYVPSSPVPGAGGLTAQISSYDVTLNVPTQLAEKTFLIAGLQYHVDSVSYAHEPPGFTPLNALHGLDLTLLLAQRLNDRWSLAFRAWPGLAGDLQPVDSGAIHIGALAMATWSPHPRFTLGGGALASYAFGQLLPLPLVYVDWQPRPLFRFEASLPFFASALFRFANRFELGALADVGGNEYAVRKAAIRKSYPCAAGTDDPRTPLDESRADPSSCTDHLAYSVVSAGAVARVRLVSSLWLGTFFGHTLFRRYDLKNADGNRVPGGDVTLPNELVFRLGLTFRIPLPPAPEPRPAR